MKRAEIGWVNFEPSVGGEFRKKRPSIIVSNDAANKFLKRVQVVPLTSQTDRIYPREAEVAVGGRPNKAMADQLTTVSKVGLTKMIGRLATSDMHKVERAITTQLDCQLRRPKPTLQTEPGVRTLRDIVTPLLERDGSCRDINFDATSTDGGSVLASLETAFGEVPGMNHKGPALVSVPSRDRLGCGAEG
jgi:mRNA interferase MazF